MCDALAVFPRSEQCHYLFINYNMDIYFLKSIFACFRHSYCCSLSCICQKFCLLAGWPLNHHHPLPIHQISIFCFPLLCGKEYEISKYSPIPNWTSLVPNLLNISPILPPAQCASQYVGESLDWSFYIDCQLMISLLQLPQLPQLPPPLLPMVRLITFCLRIYGCADSFSEMLLKE